MNTRVLLVLCIVACAHATEYFVSPFGLDKNDGKSAAKPFRTLYKANSVATSGDVLTMMDGLYNDYGANVGVVIDTDNVVVRSQNGPDLTILWCERSMSREAIEVAANNVTINGIKMLQCGEGILMKGFTSDKPSVTANGCVFDRNEEAISVNSVTIGVEVNDCIFTSNTIGIEWPQSSYSITARLAVDNCRFETNTLAINWITDGGISKIATVKNSVFNGKGTIKTAACRFDEITSVTVTDCQFNGLYSLEDRAGALWLRQITRTNTISRCNFTNIVAFQSTVWADGATKITDCFFDAGASRGQDGGAVYVSSTLTMKDTTITRYSGADDGGAIYAHVPALTNVLIKGNKATGRGGGVYSDISAESVEWNNVTIDHNSALDFGGGAYFRKGITLNNVVFQNNNSSKNGGGAYFPSSKVNLNDVLFLNNTSGGSGGGYSAVGTGIQALRCQFLNNHAAEYGGGARFIDGAVINTHSSVYSGNSAGKRGGAFFCDDSGFNLFSCTVRDNSAGKASTDGFECTGCDHLIAGSTIPDNNDCPIP